MSETPPAPQASVRRSRISLVWLIPLVAATLAAYLGYRTISQRGPMVNVTFRSGDGLTPGQTRVRHKAVELGTVEGMKLSDDLTRVIVQLRMGADAAPLLTDQAKFWVVRPRLNAGNISGLETLVSGSYIELDPGARDGARKNEFTGLEQPPSVRSDEPGQTFQLSSNRLGSLSPGAPVFYRDVTVGEVLSYELGNGSGPVTISVFVRKPYDDYVKEASHFWSASGLSVQLGATGFHVEVASLQAVLAGGVAFDTPRDPKLMAGPKPGQSFTLYRNYDEAQASGYTTHLPFVAYFESSARGLEPGAPVEFFGIQVGTVTKVDLKFDAATGDARVKVSLEIQPERVAGADQVAKDDMIATTQRLVARGMRAQLRTASYITGQLVMALDFLPSAPPAQLVRDGDEYVLPSAPGGLDNILVAVSNVAAKLERLPLDQIGANLNAALKSASTAMNGVEDLVHKTDTTLTPALRRLPEITAGLQDTVLRANRAIGSIDAGYGSNSVFARELERAMLQVGDTARSIRILADFLDRHPEALVRGRAGLSP